MAQTDARAGFRLPWSSDRQSGESPESTDPETGEHPTGPVDPAAAEANDMPASNAPDVDPWTGRETAAPARETSAAPVPTASAPASSKKPSKFLADLTKAMQAAAEDARSRALTQLQADAKTQVEVIHGRSSTDAATLRRKADDDVAAVREWSKAEIARIREETETKITDRKGRLEKEIEQHAAVIEREIDAVQKTVAAFEDDMAAFFERLLAEEDPSRFATMAENLPEPPSFDGLVAADIDDAEDEAVAEASTTANDDVVAGAAEERADRAPGGTTDQDQDGGVDRDAAFAAIQAAAEAAASAEVAVDAAARAEAVAGAAGTVGADENEDADADPRFAALGLSPDLDAAEAEAFADAGSSDEEIPEISDDAIEARLAGLGAAKGNADAGDTTATQVIVVGLVSVASIASFKRHLGRIAGVTSVGVSSGPEGEFIFAVNHGADVVLRDAIPSLPTFQARVTSTADGAVHVTAHDPEADA